VQVNLLHVLAVNRRLRAAQEAEHLMSQRGDTRRQCGGGNQTHHLAEGSGSGRVVDVDFRLGRP